MRASRGYRWMVPYLGLKNLVVESSEGSFPFPAASKRRYQVGCGAAGAMSEHSITPADHHDAGETVLCRQ